MMVIIVLHTSKFVDQIFIRWFQLSIASKFLLQLSSQRGEASQTIILGIHLLNLIVIFLKIRLDFFQLMISSQFRFYRDYQTTTKKQETTMKVTKRSILILQYPFLTIFSLSQLCPPQNCCQYFETCL